ncbi:malonate decarboxylase holo-ACP synthase [Mycolicibacterium confluentis]|uniref:Malonate decarboxylase holo-ACP synthase n=1 Tax=Mycolicibacterium confluentis TaxID=28047 RepID=A0A7I7XRK6_9MYCO|nr:malonate decarboxylase holo-ACP synthase [Mycolicibacterium confluentis]MCV7318731.1 malonate decarboxylase holo-ACP synthase [Mycolicibacterium confluentis]BBZ31879.1 malonate decarboxylase holo-ACP synthase [Mycolicibacterium confluentis]
MDTARPHDLLRLSGATALPADAPDWAVRALRLTPWAVVRRSPPQDGFIPVGVRGSSRSRRYATYAAADDVDAIKKPEELVHCRSGRNLPAWRALCMGRPLLESTGLAWGPTGSVGFELATGRATATPGSDLDLVVRVNELREVLPLLTALQCQLRRLPARVDCQVETGSGAVALAELVSSQTDVLVRTANGPRLVARTALS